MVAHRGDAGRPCLAPSIADVLHGIIDESARDTASGTPQAIGIDKISYVKGHKYVTVV